MTISNKGQKRMLNKGLYFNENDELHHINPHVDDLFHDIALGITDNQSLDYDGQISLGSKRKQKAEYKTDEIKSVRSIVSDTLAQIHEDYRWKGDWDFVSDGSHIKLIEYPTYGDTCTIKFTDRDNTTKINKKSFREWYEGKNDISTAIWEQTKLII